jgi:RNA polymerase sigma-70 factor (ECF subfamily)
MGTPSAPEPLDVLVANHRRFLAFLEKRTGSREDAEEILQSAFVRAIEKGGTIRDGESVVAWFYRLLRNAIADHWRRRATERRAVELHARDAKEADDAPDPALERVVCACVKELVPLLKPEYAALIERVDLRDEEVGRAGRTLGISAGNARVRLHRARTALRREVARACGTCADHGCTDCSCSRPAPAPARSGARRGNLRRPV